VKRLKQSTREDSPDHKRWKLGRIAREKWRWRERSSTTTTTTATTNTLHSNSKRKASSSRETTQLNNPIILFFQRPRSHFLHVQRSRSEYYYYYYYSLFYILVGFLTVRSQNTELLHPDSLLPFSAVGK
jgi:hypothetical protein